MTDISQISTEYKLAKAMEALDALVDMVGKDHSIRKTESWVVANHHLAVLKGVETMPEFWATEDAPPIDDGVYTGDPRLPR